MTEPYVDPKTEPLPLRTAPPATYRLDLLARKIRKGGFPEMAERLDTQLSGTVMWEVADECLNTLIRDREAAAAMYSARLRLELGVEDKPQTCSVCGEPDHSADWKHAAREDTERPDER